MLSSELCKRWRDIGVKIGNQTRNAILCIIVIVMVLKKEAIYLKLCGDILRWLWRGQTFSLAKKENTNQRIFNYTVLQKTYNYHIRLQPAIATPLPPGKLLLGINASNTG